MAWKVAEARQRLSEVLRNAAREPQTIYSRSRPVAVVVAVETFEEFRVWQAERKARTVGAAFAELRSLTKARATCSQSSGARTDATPSPSPSSDGHSRRNPLWLVVEAASPSPDENG
jgi:prevent-host-death family protein